jgi:hypothetical protein
MGTRFPRAAEHLSAEVIQERMRAETRAWRRRYWHIIWLALTAPRQAEEIARQAGVSVVTVHRVLARYRRAGVAAIEGVRKGGRRHGCLPLSEEAGFLAPFAERAARGWATRCTASLSSGCWQRLQTALRERVRVQQGREPTPSAAIIDSPSVKTSQQGYDGGKKVKGRKRHLLLDTTPFILHQLVHEASLPDYEGGKPLLAPLKGGWPRLKLIWADSSYKCLGFPDWVKAELGCEVEIVAHPWTGCRGVWQRTTNCFPAAKKPGSPSR